jgi:hypothetical protein
MPHMADLELSKINISHSMELSTPTNGGLRLKLLTTIAPSSDDLAMIRRPRMRRP